MTPLSGLFFGRIYRHAITIVVQLVKIEWSRFKALYQGISILGSLKHWFARVGYDGRGTENLRSTESFAASPVKG